MVAIIFLGVIIFLLGWLIFLYNKLVRLRAWLT